MGVVTSPEVASPATREQQELPVQVFIARQPILGLNLRVYGYELLYRSSTWNAFDGTEGSLATTEVIANGLMTIGLAKLVGNGFAFINFSRDLLLSDVPLMLPARNVIVEILETVEMDDAVVARCRELKRLGFQLALDDVSASNRVGPLAALADIVKVDFRQTAAYQQEQIAFGFHHSQTRLVAEKVETEEEFQRARSFGYCYFQGYFFARPAIVTARRVSSQKTTYMQVLKELTRKEVNYAQLERLFKHDPPMTYRLLRYLNSALFSWTSPIHSVRHALSLLGDEELRRWLGLLGLASLAEGKPSELIVAAVVRGRFCELLSSRARLNSRCSELFLMGLLSLFDAVLECPMEDVVAGLGMSTDVREVLLGGGDESSRLHRVFGLTLAWERADWDKAIELSQSLDLDTGIVADLYAEAVSWTDQMCDVVVLDAAIRSA
jgi:EAL and modified HD-GYP domain-containing signal transduction protein